MKKTLKWVAIIIASLVFLLTVTAVVAIWIVFTPEKLTPIVRKQAAKYIQCQSEFGKVELTFFSTFPDFGLRIDNFSLINPVEGAFSDTLLHAGVINAIVDVKAWWSRDEIVLNGFLLRNAQIHAFSDSTGRTNFDIVKTDTIQTADNDTTPLMPIELHELVFENVNVSYIDQKSGVQAFVDEFSGDMSGTVEGDSVGSYIVIENSLISFYLGNEKYMKDVRFTCDLPLQANTSRQIIEFEDASVSVNELTLFLNGSIENDTINKKLHTNLQYQLKSWQLTDILALIPQTFQSYVKGLKLEGELSSSGEIKGIYSETSMPEMNMGIQFKNGSFRYESLPLPVHGIYGDFMVYSDATKSKKSYLKINSFGAKTPASSIFTQGTILNLFSDLSFHLVTNADLVLNELKPFIPESLRMTLKGRVKGQVKTNFTMSQAEKMEIGKMLISGKLTAYNLEAKYDTIFIKTDESIIDFSLPNQNKYPDQFQSLWAHVQAQNFEASSKEEIFAHIAGAGLEFSTSDFTDTTKIPDVFSNFSFDSISVSSDTLGLSIHKPRGSLRMISQSGSKAMPSIKLDYQSEKMSSRMNKDVVAMESIAVKANISQNPEEKDPILQWNASGSLSMNEGYIQLSAIPEPVYIPSLILNFNPENFTIKNAGFKLGNSDFSLSGKLGNIRSYLKKDSLLRGDFSFSSNHTDILHLLVLTNGLGDTTVAKSNTAVSENTDVTEAVGPYLVPKGVDFILHTQVKKASLGYDTITNVSGDVRIKDGILVLDGLELTSPAARIQLTTMYRTPRKNHLYMGIDYHMLDVEISNLMKMIPEIDSMMPMLKDFKGKAEFHFAAETYLDSMYNLKMSTIRGASSIRGNDLVLMDGPTFTEISKLLKFNKKTENKVDSLAVEFTIFKNEIDIYPFLIAIDKYKAIISGRHNMDMSFDYHVSLVESPIPIKLGANISGNVDDLKYSLARPRYELSYRPVARNVVKDKQLQLRELIRKTLLQNVNTGTSGTTGTVK